MSAIDLYYNGKEEEIKIIRLIRTGVKKHISLVDIMLDRPSSIFQIDPRLIKDATLTRRIGFVTGDATGKRRQQIRDDAFISRITYAIIENRAIIIEIITLPNNQSWKLLERVFAYFLKDMEQRGIRHIELEWNEKYGRSKKFYADIGFTGGEIMLLKVDAGKWKNCLKWHIQENETESRKPNPK